MDPKVAPLQLISVFFPSLRGGGAERAMILFAGELVSMGYRVDLVVLDKEGPLAELVPPGVRIVNLGAARMSKAIPGLIRYLRTEKPYALYSTIVHSNIVAIIAGFFAPATRIIIRESNVPVTEPKATFSRWLTFKLVPFLYPKAHAVISVSEGVKDELLQCAPGIKGKVFVCPTPVFTEEMLKLSDAPVNHPWFAPGGPEVILAAARLQPHKGFATLLEAFSKIRAERDLKLIILGEGPDRTRLEKIAADLGIKDHVDFLGFIVNPFPYMKRARLFVLSSEYEGMPNVLLQALALGTQVVATDCPSGPNEILDGGRLGILVPIKNVSALTDGIKRALSDLEWGRRVDISREIREKYGARSAAVRYLNLVGL